jgi:hypothetical protein
MEDDVLLKEDWEQFAVFESKIPAYAETIGLDKGADK